jgi:anthranilate synthase component I
MFSPLNKEEYFKQASRSLIISNWIELVADLDSPIAIYSKLYEQCPDAFLFESVQGNEKIARYSFIGFRPIEKYTSQSGIDPYKLLQEKISLYKDPCEELPFFHKGFVGFFSFESVRFVEPSLKKHMKDSEFPDAHLILVGSMVVFDHVQQKIYLISNQKTESSKESSLEKLYEKSLLEIEEMQKLIFQESKLKRLNFDLSREAKTADYESNIGKEKFKAIVKTAKKHIV